MEYRFLKDWVIEFETDKIKSPVTDLRRWNNLVLMKFLKQKKSLVLNLDSADPYVFWGEVQEEFLFEKPLGDKFLTHLAKSRLVKVSISDFDRVIFFTFIKTDIYNQNISYSLIAEFIPRRSNLILAKETESGLMIVDSLKSITLASNSDRQILPNVPYQPPSTSGFEIESEQTVYPLSIDTKGKIRENSTEPDSSQKTYRRINDLFAELTKRKIDDELKKFQQQMLKGLKRQRDKKTRKIEKLEKEYRDSEKGEFFKKQAELIKINLKQIRNGMKEITVVDYYSDPVSEITIPLQENKSPLQNMNDLFKKHRKSVAGKDMIRKQIVQTENDIDKLEAEMFEIENGDPETLYNLKKQPKTKAAKKERSSFKSIRIDSDWEIFIGRTAKENDVLTCKFSKPNDWWFHTRIFQGTHVILRNYNKQELPEELLKLCSGLAAYFSRAKHSSNVPVDYTQIRYVTKPHGSAPGYVIYKNQKTLFVDPLSVREVNERLSQT
jgi:predicted ribosome quality control (RQC) complex YloA/Tae2 family protein